MRHDHHKKCLVDSTMVDTSNGPWRGSPRAGVCWSGMRKRPSISEACDNWPVHCSGYDAGRDSSVIEIISKGCATSLAISLLTKSSQDAKLSIRQKGTWESQAVHVISRKALKEATARHADLEAPLDTWYRSAKKAQWKSLTDVRKTYPHADTVGEYTVFNIKGNEYRLIVTINYRTGRIFIRHVLTHAEYNRGRWKP